VRVGITQQYAFRELKAREAMRASFAHCNALMSEGARILGRMMQGKPVANPVMLARQATDASASGLGGWLRLTVALSLALMVFNLLPLPSFDGGRAILVLLELGTGKRMRPAREAWLHTLGFWTLVGLLVWLGAANLRKVLAPRTFAPDAKLQPPPSPDGGVP
jgi:regulator of sigma E protease